MKNLLFLVVLLLPYSYSFSQQSPLVSVPTNDKTGKVEYVRVIKADSATADELFSAFEIFMGEFQVNSTEASRVNSREKMLITGKLQLNMWYRDFGRGNCHIFKMSYKAQFKDGRFRLVFTNLVHRGYCNTRSTTHSLGAAEDLLYKKGMMKIAARDALEKLNQNMPKHFDIIGDGVINSLDGGDSDDDW